MAQVTLKPRAIRDLKEISNYVAKNRSREQARNVLNKIAATIQANANYPLMGRSRNELFEGLRSFNVLSYIVFYFPIEDGIDVVRIIYSGRDLGSIDFDEIT